MAHNASHSLTYTQTPSPLALSWPRPRPLIRNVIVQQHLISILQAKALLTFVEAISEKTLRSTVTLAAARGRGKSATLGLAIASAVGYRSVCHYFVFSDFFVSYSNIFVTSPTPENLKTLFEFVFKGFDALGYQV